MAGTSRQHRGEKRRKELARKAKQEEKRQRKTDPSLALQACRASLARQACRVSGPPPTN